VPRALRRYSGASWGARLGRVAPLLALSLASLTAARAEDATELLGPLRIRDMTPFNILRLDMLPAHAVMGGPGSWAIEADISYTNTFVMSKSVMTYLEQRGIRRPLTQEDVDAIFGLGEDAYYVDGEFGLLDLTFHYAVARNTSVYVTIPAYSFRGGLLDGTIESFHGLIGNGTDGRDLVTRDNFQTVMSLEGMHTSFLEAPMGGGIGDPVIGLRHSWRLGQSHWGLVLDGAAKFALRGERSLLSTGTNDFGLQASLQGKFRRQGAYFGTSFVLTDGRVFGVKLGSRVVPTATAAYEVGLTRRTNFILQLYASESALRDTSIEEIRSNKYQASLGLRSRHGHLIYGFAVTENVANFQNTPDVGASLTLAWVSLQP
jgi:uncharacterized protein DUF3187